VQAWDDASFRIQRAEIDAAVAELVNAFAALNQIPDAETERYKDLLDEVARKATKIEDVAVLLWTSVQKLPSVGGREFCSIINEGLRSEGTVDAKGQWQESKLQRPAVLLTCLIQRHLNRTRRGLDAPVWPLGQTDPDGRGFVSEAHCVFRGAGLPTDRKLAESVLQFYELMAQTPQAVYRVSGLLATSMFEGVSQYFLERLPATTPKVLYKILLCLDDEGKVKDGRKPRHLAFLDKTEGRGEYEFLFSAFSAFYVRSVKRSKQPQNPGRPHEITLVACYDNQYEAQDVPTAPWY
jgi:hypothetical protein